MPSIPKGERWRRPECPKDLVFSQRRRHIKTRHPDTDLVSVPARTDAPLLESRHTLKHENRSGRFRRKLPADTRKVLAPEKCWHQKSAGTRKVLAPERLWCHTFADATPLLVLQVAVLAPGSKGTNPQPENVTFGTIGSNSRLQKAPHFRLLRLPIQVLKGAHLGAREEKGLEKERPLILAPVQM
jgi:hypothetical protein